MSNMAIFHQTVSLEVFGSEIIELGFEPVYTSNVFEPIFGLLTSPRLFCPYLTRIIAQICVMQLRLRA